MRPIILKLLLPAICVLMCFRVRGQTCTGSLGDPVIYQTFGAGPNPGPQLASGITTMNYTSSNCPNDGFYTISNNLSGSNNCHTTWQNVSADHTGNPNGYMMIINASEQPSIFFTQTANGLCPNTTYEFSSYVLNLITLEASGPGVSEPNILFSIETTSGTVLAQYTTGTIESTPQGQPTWNKFGVFFTTPASVADVVVKMTNLAPGGNGNDLILDDIAFRACGPIIEAGFASTSGPTAANLCEGGSSTYSLKATVVGNSNPNYQWQLNSNNTGWTDLPGKNASSLDVVFSNAVTGSYQYRVGVGNGSDISSAQCRVYSQPLTVTVNPLPVIPAIPPQTVCEGYPLQLTASGGTSYEWTGPGISPTSQNPLIINSASAANAGTYSVKVLSAQNCSAFSQTTVKVVPKVTAVVSSNATVCAGEPVSLTASGGLYYKWTPSTGLSRDDIANPIATPLQTTVYSVNVSNDGCNDDSKSITVTVRQNPVANAGSNKVIFEGQSVKLNGSVSGDELTGYAWSPALGLSDPGSLTPIANPTDNTTYTLTAISKNCGISTSSVFVRVYKKIVIPNTFSPNNDGINDYWDIEALITYADCSVTIFDRYGQRVYQNTGYAKPWDGKYNGSPLPAGTYYYIIDLKNNTPKLAGWLFLVK